MVELALKFWPQIAAAGVALAAFFGFYLKGKGDQKKKDTIKQQGIELKIRDEIIKIRRRDDVARETNRKKADKILSDPNAGFDTK